MKPTIIINASNKYFKKGSGCFTCQDCGKLTRNTGYSHSNMDDEFCIDCIKEGEAQNHRSDTGCKGCEYCNFLDEVKDGNL